MEALEIGLVVPMHDPVIGGPTARWTDVSELKGRRSFPSNGRTRRYRRYLCTAAAFHAPLGAAK
jgi:hypothetical protein